MGMKEDIQNDLKEAFDGDLADAVKAFTGSRAVNLNYDPVSNTQLTDADNYSGRGVFGSYSINEVDGASILATDIKLVCLQSEVSDTPSVSDIINGLRIIKVGKDPADATWILQLRGA